MRNETGLSVAGHEVQQRRVHRLNEQLIGWRRGSRSFREFGLFHALGVLFLLGFMSPFSASSDEIRVDDRVVETMPDGPCFDSLVTTDQSFVDCGNGTIYDTELNLLWLKQARCNALGVLGTGDWETAMGAAAGVAHGLDCDSDQEADLTDHSQPGDWRLPTLEEWIGMIAFSGFECFSGGSNGPPSITDDTGTGCYGLGLGSSFEGVELDRYWTGNIDETDPSVAHTADLFAGTPSTFNRAAFGGGFIWPVREGGSPSQAGTVKVDGAVVETRAEPPCTNLLSLGTQRYVPCGNGSVYDAVTGLLWLQDATCLQLRTTPEGSSDWPSALQKVAQLKGGDCGLSDGSQPGDWRLPTQLEWVATMAAAGDISCAPALTDTAGNGCFSSGSTPFVGVGDAEAFGWPFWSDFGPQDDAVVAVLSFTLVPCGFLQFCPEYGYLSVTSKGSADGFVWPVRELE